MSSRSTRPSRADLSARPEISKDSIEGFVRTFYRKVQDDPLIGPVFNSRIEDWEPHLQRMIMFWRAVLRGEATYSPGPKGSPPAIHQRLEEVEHEHFDRWLDLFDETVHEVLPDHKAAWVIGRAENMRKVLSRHLGPRTDGTSR